MYCIRNEVIVITGGGGFIGTSLAQHCADTNRIVIIDKWLAGNAISLTPLMEHPNVELHKCDVRDEASISPILRNATIVVHAASVVGPRAVRAEPIETVEVNVLGSLAVFHAALRSPRLRVVVYVSTSEVYGTHCRDAREDQPASVEKPSDDRWTYASSKLAAEHLAFAYHRKHGLPVVVVRAFNVFGPLRIGENAVGAFIEAALSGRDLVVSGAGDQVRAWCYIDDFLRALLRTTAAVEAVGEVFNIGNPRNEISVLDLARRVLTLSGATSRIVHRQSMTPDVSVRTPNISKATAVLGYHPSVTLDAGIGRVLEAHISTGQGALLTSGGGPCE